MSLNIALTGINAANTDLGVVSDNIANANTTGFKKARAEFGDLVDSMSAQGVAWVYACSGSLRPSSRVVSKRPVILSTWR